MVSATGAAASYRDSSAERPASFAPPPWAGERERVAFVIAGLCVVAGIVLGGSNDADVVARIIAQSLGIAAIAYWLWLPSRAQIGIGSKLTLALAWSMALLPLVQLIPLPASLWQSLPGRAVMMTSDTLTGASGAMRPWSMVPEQTLASFFQLLPALGMFLIGARLVARDHVRIALAVIGVAVFSLVFGMLQVGDSAPYLYDTQNIGLPIGLFANRNHQADLLVVAAMLAATLGAAARHPGRGRALGLPAQSWPFFYGAAIVLALGVLPTLSRAGTALMLYGVIIVLPFILGFRISRRTITIALVAVAALVVIAGIATVSGGGVLGQLGERFAADDDARFGFWPDVLYALETYFPAGAGFGSFGTVFPIAESLNEVGKHYTIHAHNDYIELVLDGGIIAALLIAFFLIWYGIVTWRLWRRRDSMPIHYVGRIASVVLPVFLLHSLIEFPLRIPALLTLFGWLAGMMRAAVMANPEKLLQPRTDEVDAVS